MHLQRGERYRVVREFMDYDATRHPVGETWRFIGSNFLPYDDGLSLYAEIDGQREQVRLQWREDQQDEIISNLAEYLAPV